MNGPIGWPPLRHRPRPPRGRHRALETVPESDMPPIPAPPQHSTAPQPSLPPPPVPAEPEKTVQCGWCKVMGPLSQIPGSGGWYRCAKLWECIPRQLAGGLPAPLSPAGTPPLEPLPVAEPEPPVVLPPAQEAAMERFNEATDAQDAAEGKDRSKDGVTPEADAEAPADTTEPAPVAAEDAAEAAAPTAETLDGGEGE